MTETYSGFEEKIKSRCVCVTNAYISFECDLLQRDEF